MPIMKSGKPSHWLSVVLLKEFSFKEIQSIIDYLMKKNIEAKDMFFSLNSR